MKKAYIIGIGGGSASGKTTLAEGLAKELAEYAVKVFHMDSCYKPEEELPLVTTAAGKTYRDYNCPEAFALEELKKDIAESVELYDLIIVEGLLTLWDEDICGRCDLRIFVDCPADIRIIRRIRRNLTWGLTLEEITEVYLDLVRARHEEYVAPSQIKADLTADSSHGIDTVELGMKIRERLLKASGRR